VRFFKKIILKLISYRQAEKIKSIFAIFLYYSGIAVFVSFFIKRGAAILVFHSISERGVFSDNRVSPAFFEQVVRYLKKRYQIVPLKRMVSRLKAGGSIPTDWIVLTFDDGYKDNMEIALPVLKNYAATGTFYITFDVLAGKKIFFYDRIQYLIDNTPLETVIIDINGKKCHFKITNQVQKDEAVIRMVLAIRGEKQDFQEEFIKGLQKKCMIALEQELFSIYLDSDDIHTLSSTGMEIGSHTISHPNLLTLSHSELFDEIQNSRRSLEKLAGREISAFSYPYGKRNAFNRKVKAQVKDSGYSSSVTTLYGFVYSETDSYELPRIGVRESQLTRLKVNLMGIPL